MKDRLVSVAVPVPFLDSLTYRVPDDLEVPAVGARVLVPLGSRQVTGCVVSTGVSPDEQAATDASIRDLVDVLDDRPFLPLSIVELALWTADYYGCGPGEAIAAAMPPFAWVESERLAELTTEGRARIADERRPACAAVLQALTAGKPVAVRTLARKAARAGTSSPVALHAAVRALAKEGLVTVSEVLRGEASAFRTVRVAALTAEGLDIWRAGAGGDRGPESGAAVRLGAKQRDAIQALAGTPEGLRVQALGDRGIAAATLERLAARGLVAFRRERVERDPFDVHMLPAAGTMDGTTGAAVEAAAAIAGSSLPVPSVRVLTGEQAIAFERLIALSNARTFRAALLHGVTGSGKTELYLRLAQHVAEAGGSALVLVPEIALTPALVAIFREAFGGRVAVQHSGLSDGERHDQWQRIRAGQVDVVVGTRSAVFAPLPEVRLIVVDEEHDTSYKQEENPRYHGRDVAVMRAKRERALVVLGSATPAIETYRNALTDRYELLTLDRRVLDRPLASVRVVNMREEYAERGPDLILSEALQAAIGDRLGRSEQVLVLLNRRGFAVAVFCRQCGGTLDCPNCSVSLTIHGEGPRRRARCHYCNYSISVPKACPLCAAPYLEQIGFGTERIEAEIRAAFPGARVARLDRDAVRRRGAVASLLGRFARRELDILVGTQMIAKGHDFPRVTLVGVISADVGLGLADFRAAERTFQLLTQVVGRAGRGERPGDAIIQTLYPDHYSIRHACRQDYAAFYEEEFRYRRAMRYPPVVAMVNAIVRGASFAAAMQEATDLALRVRSRSSSERDFRVLGPAPAPFARLRGEHRAQFFLKGTSRARMREALKAALSTRPDLRRRVTIDVDPLSVL